MYPFFKFSALLKMVFLILFLNQLQIQGQNLQDRLFLKGLISNLPFPKIGNNLLAAKRNICLNLFEIQEQMYFYFLQFVQILHLKQKQSYRFLQCSFINLSIQNEFRLNFSTQFQNNYTCYTMILPFPTYGLTFLVYLSQVNLPAFTVNFGIFKQFKFARFYKNNKKQSLIRFIFNLFPKYMEKLQQTDKPLFDNLRKLINLIDSFRDVGLHDHIELPRIAVLGTQSSGKSSLLQNIVGLDFLPRGSGVVTRRPLQLRMVHVNNPTSKPYGIFQQVDKQKKYFNFDEIRTMIESQTDKIAGKDKGIVDNPLKLTVYSYECPDLTLIDLPGITRISVGQQYDVQKVTIEMAKRYCSQDRTIILAVIPANADMSTSQGLDLARKWDPQGTRTLGVITKIDIMDRGTDASKMILNQQIPLKLGFVGIKNRSQEDINNKVKVSLALNKEEQYFRTHQIYRNIDKRYLGTRSLTKRLTQVLQKNINKHLRSILVEVNQKSKQCEEVIKSLGEPMPKQGKQKIYLIWKLLTDFTSQYKAEIKGQSKQVSSKVAEQLRLSTGSIIKSMFQELYQEQSEKNYKVAADIPDEQIQRAIKNHQGDSIPGFPSIHAFLYLLTPKLQKLRQPAVDLLNNIYTQLRKLAGQQITEVAKKAPSIMDEMINQADAFLLKLKTRTEQIMLANIDSQISYIFTNDATYLEERTKLIPDKQDKKDNKKQQKSQGEPLVDANQTTNKKGPVADTKVDRQQAKKEAEKMFVRELRKRIDEYFRISVRTLREIIPKNIGTFLVRKSQQQMQYSLYNQLLKNDQLIEGLCEPPEITQQRETAKKTLQVLNKAKRIIRREVSADEEVDKSRMSTLKSQIK